MQVCVNYVDHQRSSTIAAGRQPFTREIEPLFKEKIIIQWDLSIVSQALQINARLIYLWLIEAQKSKEKDWINQNYHYYFSSYSTSFSFFFSPFRTNQKDIYKNAPLLFCSLFTSTIASKIFTAEQSIGGQVIATFCAEKFSSRPAQASTISSLLLSFLNLRKKVARCYNNF